MFHVGEIFCRAKCDGIFLMADKSVLNILVLLDRFWMNDAYEKGFKLSSFRTEHHDL